MLSNSLKIMLRKLWNQRSYAVINIMGMAIAVTAALLLFGHIQKELSYDKFHTKAENIHRLNVGSFNSSNRSAVSSGAMAPAFVPDYPEIENFVRFRKFPSLVKNGDLHFYEDEFFYTDSTIFEVFDFELTAGNPATALDAPFNLVITEKAAKKYFGANNPIGQDLEINNQFTFQI